LSYGAGGTMKSIIIRMIFDVNGDNNNEIPKVDENALFDS
jgi:hypothetical protein